MTVEANADGGGPPKGDQAAQQDLGKIVAEKLAEALAPLREANEETRSKLAEKNNSIKTELETVKTERDRLMKKLETMGGPDGDPAHKIEAQHEMLQQLRGDYETLASQLKEVNEDRAKRIANERRRDLEDQVLQGVGPEKQKTAKLLFKSILDSKGVSFDANTNTDELARAISAELQPHLAVVAATGPQPQPRASTNQPGADLDPSQIDWNQFASIDDVPLDRRHLIPDEKFAEWFGKRTGSKGPRMVNGHPI